MSRHGPLKHPRQITPMVVRFWRRVDRGGPDDCWLWTGTLDALGRGHIGRGRTGAGVVAVQVASWEFTHDGLRPPHGYWVKQVCGATDCVNPAHLVATNERRPIKPPKPAKRLLSGEQLKEILARYEPPRTTSRYGNASALAAEYGRLSSASWNAAARNAAARMSVVSEAQVAVAELQVAVSWLQHTILPGTARPWRSPHLSAEARDERARQARLERGQ